MMAAGVHPLHDSIVIDVHVALRDVRRLLRLGIDAGILNGLTPVEYIAPPEYKLYVGWEDVPATERMILEREDRRPMPQLDIDYPLSEDGAVLFSTLKGIKINGATRWRLDLKTIQLGVRLYAERYPQLFSEWLMGTPDAIHTSIQAGVILLQLCLFQTTPDELEWRY